MPSIDIERQYVDFIIYDPANMRTVKRLRRILQLDPEPRIDPGFQGRVCEQIPGEPLAFAPMFDTTVGLLHELVDGAQACRTPDMLARHLEFSIETLSIIARRSQRS